MSSFSTHWLLQTCSPEPQLVCVQLPSMHCWPAPHCAHERPHADSSSSLPHALPFEHW
jgi:hypothetical protein